ncbi:hypothetical protein L5220_12385 [Synechococcus sp. PCC 6716]|nr:hypothetical protein [Synechococcus sp. PCC 6716]
MATCLVTQRILGMVFTFPKIIKELLSKFSTRDYSVLNTHLFISCWFGFSLDQSLRSMPDLFKRLHQGGLPMDISTFSKVNQQRNLKPFQDLYREVLGLVKRKKGKKPAIGQLMTMKPVRLIRQLSH